MIRHNKWLLLEWMAQSLKERLVGIQVSLPSYAATSSDGGRSCSLALNYCYGTIPSEVVTTYRALAFQTLADQVKSGTPDAAEKGASAREGWIEVVILQQSYTWVDIDGLETILWKNLTNFTRLYMSSWSSSLIIVVTIEDVEMRWGRGQEDAHLVAQLVESVKCSHLIVPPQKRGQQLKDPAQLDQWSRDGIAEYLDVICC